MKNILRRITDFFSRYAVAYSTVNKKMIMKIQLSIFFYLAALLMISCKKQHIAEQAPPVALKTARGSAIGEIEYKTIGPSGGTITSGDGAIWLEVPPGAVKTNTQFSIQAINKTLESSTGGAYRLGPENLTFEKDLTIHIKYSDVDVQGSSEDYLYLAYQDSEGYFHRANLTNIDRNNHILSVATRHFSDWYIERIFYLETTKKRLTANEEATLLLFFTETLPDGRLAETKPKITGETWFVNGPGSIDKLESGDYIFSLKKALYKAPASIVSPITITAGAQIRGMVDKINPDRPGTGGLVIVQTPIQLVPDEFITWEFNGVSNIGLSMDAAYLGLQTTLIGTGIGGSVSLSVNANKVGTYECGNDAEADKFSVFVGQAYQSQTVYQSHYQECNTGKMKYGNGKLIIENYGPIGGFITGKFTATVYSGSGCQLSTKQVTGEFKLRRKI